MSVLIWTVIALAAGLTLAYLRAPFLAWTAAAAALIAAALAEARRLAAGRSVEIEVETLDQLGEAMRAGARRVLLDNFDRDALHRAVKLAREFGVTSGVRVELEASGGVDLAAVRVIAGSGVDFVSAGALTKHVRAIDLSLRFAAGE